MHVGALRSAIGGRRVKLGHLVFEFATPGIGYILKAADCDYAVLDMEHSGLSFETVKAALRYMEAADLPAVVRIPTKAKHHLARACDIGAEGLMVPMVSSADEARRIVDAIKFPPDGRRGISSQIAHDRYRPGPLLEKMADANRRVTLFAQIESVSGVESANDIAAIPGVDCLWIGHMDLSVDLGIPGQFEHADFVAAVDTVERAAKYNGKSLGRLVRDECQGIELYRRGYDFICYSSDTATLQAGVAGGVAAIRVGCRALD